MKRWVMASACCLLALGPGALGAYSFLMQPWIAGAGSHPVTAVAPFALTSCFFGVGALLGGFWLEREHAGRVALTACGMWALGNTLSGLTFVGLGSGWLFLGYGVFGGLGCGAACITALTLIMRWLPEKRGLGSGLIVMSLGLGAFAYASALRQPLAYAVPSLPHRTLGTTMMEIIIVSGAAFLLLGVLTLPLEEPPEDDARFIPSGPQATPGDMLRHTQFYIHWTMLLLSAAAGLALIADAAPLIAELTGQTGSAGLGLYLFIMPAAAFGGLFWGALSDRVEHRWVLSLLFGLQSAAFLALGGIRDPLGASIALAVIFFCYGGALSVLPALHVVFFGTEHFSVNYGIMLTAWSCAGIFAPLFYAAVKSLTGSYVMAFQPMGLVLLTAIVFPLISERAPRARAAEKLPPAQPARRLPAPHH